MFEVENVEKSFKTRIWMSDEQGNEVFVKIYEDYSDQFNTMDLLLLRSIIRSIVDSKIFTGIDYIFSTMNNESINIADSEHEKFEFTIYYDNIVLYMISEDASKMFGIPQYGVSFWDGEEYRIIPLSKDEYYDLIISKGAMLKDVLLFMLNSKKNAKVYDNPIGFRIEDIEFNGSNMISTIFTLFGVDSLVNIGAMITGMRVNDVRDFIKSNGFMANEILDELSIVEKYEKVLNEPASIISFDSVWFGRKYTFNVRGALWRNVFDYLVKPSRILEYEDNMVEAEGSFNDYMIEYSIDHNPVLDLMVTDGKITSAKVRDNVGSELLKNLTGVNVEVPSNYSVIVDFNSGRVSYVGERNIQVSDTEFFECEVVADSPEKVEEIYGVVNELRKLGFYCFGVNTMVYSDEDSIRIVAKLYPRSIKVAVGPQEDKDEIVNVYRDVIERAMKILNCGYVVKYGMFLI